MTAKLELPEGADWLYEPKLDGSACGIKYGDQVRLQTGAGTRWEAHDRGLLDACSMK